MKDTESAQEVPPRRSPPEGRAGVFRRLARNLGYLLGALLILSLLWWLVGRATAPSRRLSVHFIPDVHLPAQETSPGAGGLAGSGPRGKTGSGSGGLAGSGPGGPAGSGAGRLVRPGAADAQGEPGAPERSALSGSGSNDRPLIRVLAWNIAHGRGDVQQGWMNNWRGGDREERMGRLMGIVRVIRDADADLVILNEADFRAQWSDDVNQAEILARGAGYSWRMEQRNYDLQFPFWGFAFGNALLSRTSILEAEWVGIPPHSTLEALALGAKSASVARLETRIGPLALVPVHLEFRPGPTRMAALSALDSLQAREEPPVILAGDFNTAPTGWPAVADGTLLDSLLARGWTSPRARGGPAPEQLTFPTPGLLDARDWILVEPPLEVVEARVLHEAGRLSDHAPVLAVIGLRSSPPTGQEGESVESRAGERALHDPEGSLQEPGRER